MSKVVLSAFEEYQKERVRFVQAIAELARQPQNIEPLQASGVMKLLRPLLLDNVSSIQQSAALALARLASYSVAIAESIVTDQVLSQLIDSLSRQNRFYKKAASYVLKSVAQHSEHLAQCVIDAGALEPLVECLEEFDPNVKEGAAFALAQIAKHENPVLAEEIAKAGAIEHLSNCIQDPETSLKKVAAIAICEIAKHNAELAEKVAVHPGTLKAITATLKDRDMELRQNACTCLANVAKHNEEIAHKVANADLFPAILDHGLKEDKPGLQRQAMQCIKEIAGQSAELSKMVVDAKALEPIVDYLNKTTGPGRLPAIMTLGFISGFSKEMTKIVLQHKGHIALVRSLKTSTQPHIQSAAAWSLGQIAKNSEGLTHELEDAKVTDALLRAYLKSGENADLKSKSRRALRNIIEKAQDIHTLTPLLKAAPEKILKRVVRQLANLLKADPKLKTTFAGDGYLEQLQDVKVSPESKLGAAIVEINKMYPDDVVHYFTKGYMDALIKQEEEYLHQ